MAAGIRDNEFDAAAHQRLISINLQAKREGWTPQLLISAANLSLHLGHWKQAEDFAGRLSASHPADAADIIEKSERLAALPPRTRREWVDG